MHRTTFKRCFLVVIFISTLCTASSEDDALRTMIDNLKSKTDMKSRSLKKSKSIASMMDFDIGEDSTNEEELLQRILSRVNVLNSRNQQQKLKHLPAMKLLSRRRKSIFGMDDRNLVETSVKAQTYPYSTVVSLSSGCTGTLVGVQHVLTAAHCVHDGRKILKQARTLRIGILQSSGTFQWIKVGKIHLPRLWKTTNGKRRIQHDYALLTLKRPHSRPIMAIKPSALKTGSPMQFAGFHSDKKQNAMWLSRCRVVVAIRGGILSFCDGVQGISGSGVYVHSSDAIVGVVSAVGKGRLRGKKQLFNVVISFTPKMVRKLKKWIKKSKRKRQARIRIKN